MTKTIFKKLFSGASTFIFIFYFIFNASIANAQTENGSDFFGDFSVRIYCTFSVLIPGADNQNCKTDIVVSGSGANSTLNPNANNLQNQNGTTTIVNTGGTTTNVTYVNPVTRVINETRVIYVPATNTQLTNNNSNTNSSGGVLGLGTNFNFGSLSSGGQYFGFSGGGGATGATGATGAAGPQGEIGLTGVGIATITTATDTFTLFLTNGSSTLINLLAGPQGLQGATGTQGLVGATGTAGTVGVGISSIATTTDSFTLYLTNGSSTLINLIAGAKGEKGDIGVTGLTGPQGLQGFKGDKGDVGEKGDKGDKGNDGTIGVDGAKGDKGDTGAQGIAGKDGVSISDISTTSNSISFALSNGSSTFVSIPSLTDLEFATITNLKTSNLNSDSANFIFAHANDLEVDNLNAIDGFLENFGFATASGVYLESDAANFIDLFTNSLSAQIASIFNLNFQNAIGTNLTTQNQITENLAATNSTLTNATATNLFTDKVLGNFAAVNFLQASSSIIDFLGSQSIFSQFATIFDLGFNSATGTNLQTANIATTNLTATGTTNLSNANILSGTGNFDNASITNASSTNLRVNTSTNLSGSTKISGDLDLSDANLTLPTGPISYATITDIKSTNINTDSIFAKYINSALAYFENLGFNSATGTNIQLANTVTSNLTATGTTNLADSNILKAEISGGNATLSSATSTNFVSSNLLTNFARTLALNFDDSIGTNSTSTNLFSSALKSVNGNIDELLTKNATITNALFTNFVAQNSTTSNSTTTNLFAENINAKDLIAKNASFTILYADVIRTIDVAYTGIVGERATITEATTTYSFSKKLAATTGKIINGSIDELLANNATITNAVFESIAVITNANLNDVNINGVLNTSGAVNIATSSSLTNYFASGQNATNYFGTGDVTTNYFGNSSGGNNIFGGSGVQTNTFEAVRNTFIGTSAFQGDVEFDGNLDLTGQIYIGTRNTTAPVFIGSIQNDTNLDSFNIYIGASSTETHDRHIFIGNSFGTVEINNPTTVNASSTFIGDVTVGKITSTTTLVSNDLVGNFATITNASTTNIYGVNGWFDNLYLRGVNIADINPKIKDIVASTTVADFATTTEATTTNLFAQIFKSVNGNIDNLATNNFVADQATITSATTTNFFAKNISSLNGKIDEFLFKNATGSNLRIDNQLSARLAQFDQASTTFLNANNLTASSFVAVMATITNGTSTTWNTYGLSAIDSQLQAIRAVTATITNASTTNISGVNAWFDNLNVSGVFSVTNGGVNISNTNIKDIVASTTVTDSATITSATSTNMFAQIFNSVNSKIDNLIVKNIVGDMATFTSATTTNLFATNFKSLNGKIDEFLFNNATGTNLRIDNQLSAHLANFDEASSTYLYADFFKSPSISGNFASITSLVAGNINVDSLDSREIRLQYLLATITQKLSVGGPFTTNNYKVNFVDNVPGTQLGDAAFSMTNLATRTSITNTILRLNTGANSSSVCGINALSGSLGVCAYFIDFYASSSKETDGLEVGKILLSSNGAGGQRVVYNSAGADFGEILTMYEDTDFGDIVGQTVNGYEKVIPGKQIVGVVSDNTAFVGNSKKIITNKDQTVGYLGIIITKVTTENGAIKKGDTIGIGSIPGVGVKMLKAGYIVGHAIESFNGEGTGKIEVQVAPTWYDPEVLANGASISTTTVGLAINTALNNSYASTSQNLISSITNSINSTIDNSIANKITNSVSFLNSTSTLNASLDNLFVSIFNSTTTNLLDSSFAATSSSGVEKVSFANMQLYMLQSISTLNQKVDDMNSKLLSVAEIVTNKLTANEIKTDRLCVGDTCINETDLKEFMDYKKSSAIPPQSDEQKEQPKNDTPVVPDPVPATVTKEDPVPVNTEPKQESAPETPIPPAVDPENAAPAIPEVPAEQD
jgi:hypothetical protein